MTQIRTDLIFLICVICVYLRLKNQLQPKLNITRRAGCRNLSKRPRTAITLEIAEIGSIESVKYISLEPQLKPLRQPKMPAQREVPRLRARAFDRAGAASAATRIGRGLERGRVGPAIWTTLAVQEERVADAIRATISESRVSRGRSRQ